MNTKYVNDAFKALVTAVDAAATAETKTGHAKPGYWRTAKARLVELYRIVEPGVVLTEAEICDILGQEPPKAQDPSEPMKGARIVVLYRIPGHHSRYHFPHAAVRKRPKVEQYEAVSGYEEMGVRANSGSIGFKWTTLHGVYPNAMAAKDALAELFELHVVRR